MKVDIEGNILDSFHIAFQHNQWAIDPKILAMKIEHELHDRLFICRKLNKTYVVNVVISELEGDDDAISKGKES